MKRTLSSIAVLAMATLTLNHTAISQGKADVLNEANEITWLGLDFSQTKFIGTAYQFKDAGEITNEEFVEKYAPGWNQLFIDEAKKYDVADAVHRVKVKYATDVTDKVNAAIKGKDFFSNDPDDYKKLNEEKVAGIIKKYNFKDYTGIGLVFIVDGMSKSKSEAGAWVTFVDMKSKKVLYTYYGAGKATGITGFRNYWATAFLKILKDLKKEYSDMKKG